MESRIASSCSPMTLRERKVLDAKKFGFLIPPLHSIFPASATQVLTKALLKVFINHLLSTIHHDNTLTEIPNKDCWGLTGNGDSLIDLDRWDPLHASQDVYKVIALPVKSDLGTRNPIHPQWAILGGGLRPSPIKSVELLNRQVFEIDGSHLLLVVYCQKKVKVSKKKSIIEATKYSILIPANLKVADLVEAFKVTGNVSGVFEIPDSMKNIQTRDTRTAIDLGWRYGTELRLEML